MKIHGDSRALWPPVGGAARAFDNRIDKRLNSSSYLLDFIGLMLAGAFLDEAPRQC